MFESAQCLVLSAQQFLNAFSIKSPIIIILSLPLAQSTLHSALGTQHWALCTGHYALGTMHYALGTMHWALGTMH